MCLKEYASFLLLHLLIVILSSAKASNATKIVQDCELRHLDELTKVGEIKSHNLSLIIGNDGDDRVYEFLAKYGIIPNEKNSANCSHSLVKGGRTTVNIRKGSVFVSSFSIHNLLRLTAAWCEQPIMPVREVAERLKLNVAQTLQFYHTLAGVTRNWFDRTITTNDSALAVLAKHDPRWADFKLRLEKFSSLPEHRIPSFIYNYFFRKIHNNSMLFNNLIIEMYHYITPVTTVNSASFASESCPASKQKCSNDDGEKTLRGGTQRGSSDEGNARESKRSRSRGKNGRLSGRGKNGRRIRGRGEAGRRTVGREVPGEVRLGQVPIGKGFGGGKG